jgi:hypothetical protein
MGLTHFGFDRIRKHDIQVIAPNEMYHANAIPHRVWQYLRIPSQLLIHQFETDRT